MGVRRTSIAAVCLLVMMWPVAARAAAAAPFATNLACAVAPSEKSTGERQDVAVARTGRIPGLGTVQGTLGWDNRMSVTLLNDKFVVRRTLDPLTRSVEITISGEADVPLSILLGGPEPPRVLKGKRPIDLSDARAMRGALDGEAVSAFRELIGNYQRALIAGRPAARADDPHGDGFLLIGAFLSSLGGDPTAMAVARDLIFQRIRGKLNAVRFDFRDCVTEYERYLLKIDGQRSQCLDAANDRDSWYARAADRLGCEAEFMAAALAGEGQFASCTTLGAMFA
jgi:hypothetical protein